MTDANQGQAPFSGAQSAPISGSQHEGGEAQDHQAQQAKIKSLQRGDNVDMQGSAVLSSSLVSLGQIGLNIEANDRQAAPTNQPNPEVLRLI